MTPTLDVMEILKVIAMIAPAVWFLTDKLKDVSGKIDSLEARIDGKVGMIDQKIDSNMELIDTKIKQYADREQLNVDRLKSIEDRLRVLTKRLDRHESDAK